MNFNLNGFLFKNTECIRSVILDYNRPAYDITTCKSFKDKILGSFCGFGFRKNIKSESGPMKNRPNRLGIYFTVREILADLV